MEVIDTKRRIILETPDCLLKSIDPRTSEKDRHLLPFEAIITTGDRDLDGETILQGVNRDGRQRIDFSYWLYPDRRLGRARGNVHEGHTDPATGTVPPERMLGYPVSAQAGSQEALVKGFFAANPNLPGGRRARSIWEYTREVPGSYNPSFEALPIRNDIHKAIVEGALVIGLAISDKVKNPGTALAAGWGNLIAKAIESAGDFGGGYQGQTHAGGSMMPQDRGGSAEDETERRGRKRTKCHAGCKGLKRALIGATDARDAFGRGLNHLQKDHGMTETEAFQYFATHIRGADNG